MKKHTELSQNNPILWALVLVLVAVIFYIPALKAGFVWDDDALTNNPLIKSSWEGFKGIWLKPSIIPREAHYWPLVYTSFWLEYRLWSFHPAGYHLVNVVLHALNGLLVWIILKRLKLKHSWFMAAVFAVHPIHVESVAWIIERKDVLSACFFLCSFLFFTRFYNTDKKRHFYYLLSLVFFICALLSKSIVIGLPLVFLLWIWWKRARITRKDLLQVFPFLLIALGITVFDLWLFRQRTSSLYGFGFWERCIIAGRAFWFYILKIVYPNNLMPVHLKWKINQTNIIEYIPGLFAIVVMVLLYRFRERLGKAPVTLFLFYAIMIAPVLGFIDFGFMRYSYVAERFQYLAGLGIIILFISGITSISKRYLSSALLNIGGVCILLILGILTWKYNGNYRDYETLFRYNIKKNPRAWVAHNNLATALEKKGDEKNAIRHYEKALELKPEEEEIHYNLGALYARRRDKKNAIYHYKNALRINPKNPGAHNNLGFIYEQEGNPELAIEHYRQSLSHRKNHFRTHNNMGNALMKKGDIKGAIRHWEEAIRLNPLLTQTVNNLAWIYATNKNPDLRNCEKAL